jgi:heme-degrading monooxygenase HmoA
MKRIQCGDKRWNTHAEVTPAVVQIACFRSGLSDKQVVGLYEERAPRYRALKGLRQKYYLRYPEMGEHGAVYVWESEADLKDFRESELGRSIASTYQVQGASQVRLAEVVLVLRSEKGPA